MQVFPKEWTWATCKRQTKRLDRVEISAPCPATSHAAAGAAAYINDNCLCDMICTLRTSNKLCHSDFCGGRWWHRRHWKIWYTCCNVTCSICHMTLATVRLHAALQTSYSSGAVALPSRSKPQIWALSPIQVLTCMTTWSGQQILTCSGVQWGKTCQKSWHARMHACMRCCCSLHCHSTVQRKVFTQPNILCSNFLQTKRHESNVGQCCVNALQR